MKKKLRSLFEGLPIHRKILTIYSFCIIPIIIILCIAVLFAVKNIIMTNIVQSVSNNSEVIVNQMQQKTKNMKSCANILQLYLNELPFLRSGHTVKLNEIEKNNQVMKRMLYSYQIFEDVDNMIFIDQTGNVYGNDVNLLHVWKQKDNSSMLAKMEEIGSKEIWFPINTQNSISEKENACTLTMGKNMVDVNTGERLGMLFLSIEETSINKLFSSLSFSGSSHYFITSLDGKIVMAPPEVEKENINKMDLNKVYVNTKSMAEIPYDLVFYAVEKELFKEIEVLMLVIIFAGITCITLAVVLSHYLAKRITKPIIQLANDMETVSRGDISVRCSNEMRDETKRLADGFNTMLETIEDLIKNVKLEQKEKRKYELALIQSQIKPHFLYNTLDAIYVLIHLGRNEDAKLTTKSLADFYRAALSAGKEIIRLSEEIKCIQDYLKIQKIRYAEEFEYRIEIAEELYTTPILKMLIQPIVENAIYHGLKEKEGMGMLRIYSVLEDDYMNIVVEDNGAGMTKEKISDILENGTTGSFGLKSVNERIRLHWGDSYKLRIESTVNERTRVILRIPYQKGGRNV